MSEEWRATRTPHYEVSNHGRVRRADTLKLKGSPLARNGYPVVNLWHQNAGRVHHVHVLVAEAFIGPRPEKLCVNHKDGDKTNNHVTNLEYVTYAVNSAHALATGLAAVGERAGNCKLTQAQALEIRRRANEGERTRDLAREFGVAEPTISEIKTGRKWRHLPPPESRT